MAEKRRFAALTQLRQPQALLDETAAAEPGLRGRGRPATGKRSNPEWKLYSHFLKIKTQKAAVAKLHLEDSGRDLSDVLQELLEGWLQAQ